MLADEIHRWNNPCARAAAELRRLHYENEHLTALVEAQQPAPVSSDTLYLLRRLLSNQHTLTSAEFREELTKIVEEAAMRQIAS